MAPTKKVKEAIKEQLSKEDLIKLLSEKPQKQVRKKRDLDEEAKVKMNERMSQMRVLALEKRQALKKEKQLLEKTAPTNTSEPSLNSRVSFQQPKESNIDLFEKKYNSQFEKMNDTLSKLDIHLNEMKDLKKSKREMILNFGKQAMIEKQRLEKQDLENPARKDTKQDLENPARKDTKQDLENPARKIEQPELKKGSREVEIVKPITKPSLLNQGLVVPKINYKNIYNANKYY